MAERPVPGWQRALYLVAWPFSAFLVLVDALAIREVLLDVLALVGTRRGGNVESALEFGWLAEFMDRTFLLLAACVALGLAIAFEHYYRQGLARGLLIPRVARIMGIEIAIALAGLLVRALL